MAELQPPEGQLNGGAMLPALPPENVGTKRQRRPSVRLGEIGGDQSYEAQPHGNRRAKQWKLPGKETAGGGGSKSSKTRALMNLTSSGDYNETLDGEDKEVNLDSVAIGSWKIRNSKSKRGSMVKKVRSGWYSKASNDGAEGQDGNENVSGGEDIDDGYRDFEHEGSDQSPIHSLDNMGVDADQAHLHRRGGVRSRVSEGREHHNDGVEVEVPSDTDGRNWNHSERNGVKVWLNQLGLGRYAPVFEIHEVDDEVLPMLTLEDLKDMGINAVGSRRKMYCSIQKLGKGFS